MLLGGLAFAQPNAASAEITPASLATARQIVGVVIPPDRRAAVFGATVREIVAQSKAAATARVADPGLRALVVKRLDAMPARLQPGLTRHIPMLMEAVARAYAREFSGAELTQIAAFARGAAGAHYLSRSMTLGNDPDVAAANKAYLSEALHDFAAMQQDMATDMRAYIAKHPGSVPSGAPSPAK